MKSDFPWSVKFYCELVGFFALDAEQQRHLIPNETEPKYASFKGGDGLCSRPLEVLLGNLYDASGSIQTHLDEPGYDSFINEDLLFKLSEVLVKFDERHEEGTYELSALDWRIWDELRQTARNIWNNLDENHRLPMDNWWHYYG